MKIIYFHAKQNRSHFNLTIFLTKIITSHRFRSVASKICWDILYLVTKCVNV